MTHHQPALADDVPLTGGRMTSGIVRRGDRLRRPIGPWSPAVHEYLRHLESVGFEGSPRVLGVEGDTEVLTYLDGDVAVDPQWEPGHGNRLPPYARTDLALRGAAELLRKLHMTAAGFQPAMTSYRFHPPRTRTRTRPGPGKSSPTVTLARGTSSTATGYRWPQSGRLPGHLAS